MNKKLKRFLRVATLACAVTLSVGFVADQAQAKDYYVVNNMYGKQIYIVGSDPINYKSTQLGELTFYVTAKVVDGNSYKTYRVAVAPYGNKYRVVRDGLSFGNNDEMNRKFFKAVRVVYYNQLNGIY